MMRPYITALSGLLVLMLFQNCAPFAPTGLNSAQDSATSFSSVDPDFVCLPNQDPSPSDLRRLSKTQYTNTIRDLVRGLTVAEKQTALTTILQTEIPDDQFTTFDRTDVNITKSHLNAYYLVASRFGDHMTSSNTLMEKFLSHYAALDTASCATLTVATLGSSCRDAFIRGFGKRAFRRPLEQAEFTNLLSSYTPQSTLQRRMSAVIFRILMSPPMLLLLENKGNSIRGDSVIQLTPYELASRLSYHFWDTMQDETLL